MDKYGSTDHSYISVRSRQRFINWNSQPKQYKNYPYFYSRLNIDKTSKEGSFLSSIASINFEKKVVGGGSYSLRINPSAGALYPNELYVQIRGVVGFEDGVYHYEVSSASLVFLAPISAYGLEYFLRDKRKVQGFLFFVSAAYFRSSWKYENRSIRYCLLDAGHLLGCIEASASLYEKNVYFETDLDFEGANNFFGFENKEFTVCAAVCGERVGISVEKPPFVLPFVTPYDYFERNSFVEEWLSDESKKRKSAIASRKYDGENLLDAINTRRSIRAFAKKSISINEFERLFGCFEGEHIDVFYVVNRVVGVDNGLYHRGRLLKSGDFSQKAGYLCLEQALGSDSAVTIFILAKADDLWCSLLEAGLVVHRIYLEACRLGIGTSGIGAYYDEEVRSFIGSDKKVLYAAVFGR